MMADVSKFKKAGKLGSPPLADDVSGNLDAPETAPVEGRLTETIYSRRDGRSMRKTNRTLPFATRVSPDFDMRIRDIAERDGLKLVEVLEKALEAYEKNIAAR